LGATVPFSLDAALKGTIPSYSGSLRDRSKESDSLLPPDSKSSWFFDIHEDTPEQEMTNLLQHSTCTLDISSDEESERRASRDRAEGRDKENIPPADDISQTSARFNTARAAAADFDDMVVEKQRGPLAEMNVADYYAEGCDEASVVIVPGDEDDEGEEAAAAASNLSPVAEVEEEPQPPQEDHQLDSQPPRPRFDLADVDAVDVDDIMGNGDRAANAAVLDPVPGTGESFELWESGSAKDDDEAPASAAQAPVNVEEGPVPVSVVVF
jgi:hypothetical protein